VDKLISYGLNTVRVPLGFWIIEGIVDRSAEPYAQGGIKQLIRGLYMLKKAGIHVTLDHHALPGVAAINQMFAGNCSAVANFYVRRQDHLYLCFKPLKDKILQDDYNYKRAVTWAAAMTYLIHVHPDFSSVFAIEAANEPIMDYVQTPGLDSCTFSAACSTCCRFALTRPFIDYDAFVLGVRAVELSLGIICDTGILKDAILDPITRDALIAAAPIIYDLTVELGLPAPFSRSGNPFQWPIKAGTLGHLLHNERKCLFTK
jgi:hypothetical protein